ncbi:HDIG domain-containing protein [Candidatus Woesearchaeota archaeon]|jgi:putative nucleotidyltransferase with HDIG domain|nr:HDIG domain-containing protein [Candidatus Woesearchaeota archaeon]
MESRIPSEEECLELMAAMSLAPAILHHSLVVRNVALGLADDLEKRGFLIDRKLVSAAALLHDIMKMGAVFCHGVEGGEFLRSMGFDEVASVVEKHCLNNLEDPELVPKTNEEKLLMYADLRVNAGKIVTLDERFRAIKERYTPKDPKALQEYITFAKQLEWELLGKVEK